MVVVPPIPVAEEESLIRGSGTKLRDRIDGKLNGIIVANNCELTFSSVRTVSPLYHLLDPVISRLEALQVPVRSPFAINVPDSDSPNFALLRELAIEATLSMLGNEPHTLSLPTEEPLYLSDADLVAFIELCLVNPQLPLANTDPLVQVMHRYVGRKVLGINMPLPENWRVASASKLLYIECIRRPGLAQNLWQYIHTQIGAIELRVYSWDAFMEKRLSLLLHTGEKVAKEESVLSQEHLYHFGQNGAMAVTVGSQVSIESMARYWALVTEPLKEMLVEGEEEGHLPPLGSLRAAGNLSTLLEESLIRLFLLHGTQDVVAHITASPYRSYHQAILPPPTTTPIIPSDTKEQTLFDLVHIQSLFSFQVETLDRRGGRHLLDHYSLYFFLSALRRASDILGHPLVTMMATTPEQVTMLKEFGFHNVFIHSFWETHNRIRDLTLRISKIATESKYTEQHLELLERIVDTFREIFPYSTRAEEAWIDDPSYALIQGHISEAQSAMRQIAQGPVNDIRYGQTRRSLSVDAPDLIRRIYEEGMAIMDLLNEIEESPAFAFEAKTVTPVFDVNGEEVSLIEKKEEGVRYSLVHYNMELIWEENPTLSSKLEEMRAMANLLELTQ